MKQIKLLFVVLLLQINIYSNELDDYIPVIKHNGYYLQYNPNAFNPIWVMYIIDKENLLEENKRDKIFFSNDYMIDIDLKHNLFYNSGFDRGHMCPAEDKQNNYDYLVETFYLSNVSPQVPGLNRGIWKSLENNIRKRVKNGEKLLVISGTVFYDLKNTNKISGKIFIPDAFYKIVYNINNKKINCYLFENKRIVNRNIDDFQIELKDLEKLIGIYFNNLR
jgi:endonuclease G